MTTLWAFIILLGVLITIHEYGHFMAARSVGVRVERFSIGVPPRFITIESVDNGLLCKLFFFKRTGGLFKWKPIFQKHFPDHLLYTVFYADSHGDSYEL